MDRDLPIPLVPPRKTAVGGHVGAAAMLAARTTERGGI